MRVLYSGILMLILVVVFACGAKSPASPGGGSVTITPSEVSVRAGGTVQMVQRPAVDLFPNLVPYLGFVQINTNSGDDKSVIIYHAERVTVTETTKVVLELRENDSRGAVRASATITVVP